MKSVSWIVMATCSRMVSPWRRAKKPHRTYVYPLRHSKFSAEAVVSKVKSRGRSFMMPSTW